MARTAKTDLPSVSLPIGNGSSMLTPSFPLLDLGKFSRVSDFSINPPNVRIDADIKKIVEKESERLRLKTFKYGGEEADWHLHCIMESPDGVKDNAKTKLMRDGKSAVVSEVSKSINASSIDHTSKFLLSNEPLYVFALSHAIYQERVEDAEGLNDRILSTTENKIKTHFNKLLAKKVIRDKHLDLTEDQRKKILNAVATTNISYLQGEPAKSINKIIAKYVDYGHLNILVDKFFESGIIDADKGTPQVRQLMVKYLIEIGLTINPEDLIPENVPSGESPQERTPSGSPVETSGKPKTTTK
jgi:hypothetical protein